VSPDKFIDMLEPAFLEEMGRTRTLKQIAYVEKGIILPLMSDTIQTLELFTLRPLIFLLKWNCLRYI